MTLLVIGLLSLLPSRGLEAAESQKESSNTGDRPVSDGDPSLQVEKDWVDNRWNRTEIGPFLASNFDLPNGRVLKGLAIKLGDEDQTLVCYNTKGCALQAGWTSGSLQFSGVRFGLIDTPRISGQVIFTADKLAQWAHTKIQFRGFHLDHEQVRLEYWIDGRRVFEVPRMEKTDAGPVLSRSFDLEPSGTNLVFILGTAAETTLSTTPGGMLAVTESDGQAIGIALRSDTARFQISGDQLTLQFPTGPNTASLLWWSGKRDDRVHFEKFASSIKPLTQLDRAVPATAKWLPELRTVGQRGLDSGILAIDTLTVPYENPWKALMFLSGIDFTRDGTGYACTIHGEVWRISGIDPSLRELRWKRYATGLFQPLGLKVKDDQVYVLGRDQITRLHDRDGNGEADFYENFCNQIDTRPGHNYVTCLETDSAGNFYYVDTRGVHRISADGQQHETLATGFRNPNSLGVSPDGSIVTVGPQQGEWTPSSAICEIKRGGYYGYGGPKVQPDRPLGYDPPLCWIPHSFDNSSGSQVWVPANRWGPLAGKMLHLLWGRCGMALVLRSEIDGTTQGAVVPLPGRFLSGPNRGSFNPTDGHLYVAGSTGWQTSAVKDGALHRVRYTSKPVYLPLAWRAHRNGLTVAFSQPLDRGAAEDPDSYSIHQWNYKYAAQYGSDEWSVRQPDNRGRDEVKVKAARLLQDGRTVFLEIPDLQPVMQMELKYNLLSADDRPMRHQFWLSIQKLAPSF